MRILYRAVLAAGLIMLGLASADAAAIQGRAVTACGTRSYGIGSDNAIDMLRTGELCTSGSGGSGGGGDASAANQVTGNNSLAAINAAIGAKTDAKSAATDTTAASIVAILKEISSLEQAPITRAVTNTGTFATQSAVTAASGAYASGSIASGAFASGSVASGAYASGSIADGAMVTIGAKTDAKSTATDATSITIMQVLKEISALEQAPASRAVTNAGTFAVQVSSALPAGSNVIGHVIIDTGSTTAVTGTVTVAGATTAADATALTANAKVFATEGLYNGSTIDLARAGDVNNQAAVTGVQDILAVARYNATLPTITDTRYNALQEGQRGALEVQIMNADGTTGWAFASPADAQALAASAAPVRGVIGLYNGATTDMARDVANATNSVGTGIAAVGNLAQFDDVSPTAITENSFGNLRMSANRNVYGTIRDAGGNERGVNVAAASTSAALADPALVVSLSPNPDTVCTGVTAINQTTSTDVKTFTAKGHICSIILVSATAQNIGIIEGTGTVCATGTAALLGGTTASLAAGVNGGFSAVSDRAWMQTQTTGDHLCILQSASGNVSGIITWQDHS